MLEWYDEAAANDRLGFAMLVALLVHAGLILGVGFAREDHAPAPKSLEITLAQYRDERAAKDADFLAQSNQLGSGSLALKSELSTPVASEQDASAVKQVLHRYSTPAAPPSADTPAITTTREAQQRIAASDAERAPAPLAPADLPPDNAQSVDEIASLLARLDARQRAYAKLPKVRRVTSVSTRAAADAAYLLNWTHRIETIGNEHYPVEARTRRLYGDLRLLVAVAADGSVREVRVLQSSGHRVLDDAAMRIVRLAAPFDAFPAELRTEADTLEIIRTWQFRSNRLSAGQ